MKEQTISRCYSVGTLIHLRDLWAVLAKPNSSVAGGSGMFSLEKGLEYASNSTDKLQTFSSS